MHVDFAHGSKLAGAALAAASRKEADACNEDGFMNLHLLDRGIRRFVKTQPMPTQERPAKRPRAASAAAPATSDRPSTPVDMEDILLEDFTTGKCSALKEPFLN